MDGSVRSMPYAFGHVLDLANCSKSLPCSFSTFRNMHTTSHALWHDNNHSVTTADIALFQGKQKIPLEASYSLEIG